MTFIHIHYKSDIQIMQSLRGASAPLSFSSPFPSQGKGDKGGWGQQIKPEGGEVDKFPFSYAK